jgi:hypothetical protein
MRWKVAAIVLILALILVAGCTDTLHKKCDWVGPGGRAVYVCKAPS